MDQNLYKKLGVSVSIPVFNAIEKLVQKCPGKTKKEIVEEMLREGLNKRGEEIPDPIPEWEQIPPNEWNLMLSEKVIVEVHKYSTYFVAMDTENQQFIGSYAKITDAKVNVQEYCSSKLGIDFKIE
ncbi:hypothetical protein ACMXYO_01075 [Neptuniibacter sp. QD37_6]|uniref:hypothetical protein n=1 Tax=Neptuniibacter sp. QD37_6 TaxID=3398210 RepID=UPI0039F50F54